MLHPDRVRDVIHYMSGPEFERFMADSSGRRVIR
jgi:hypothetical protein